MFNPREHLMQIREREHELLAKRSMVAKEALRVDGDPFADKYIERFLARMQVSDNDCWLWTSTLNNKGYARLGMYRRLVLVHRWAYLLFKGVVPEGLELDHLCRNPCCVNPNHLEPVTHRENNLRGKSLSAKHAGKTHCPQGHPYSEENTHLDKRGTRNCRACRREKSREYRKKLALETTHCPKGHLYNLENIGVDRNGRRYCKQCSKIFTPTYYMQQTSRKEIA